MLRCAFTGQIIEHPVATPRGIVYERATIESYLQKNSFDPIDKQPLRIDQLIPLQIDQFHSHSATIRNPSFGGLLSGVANEFSESQKEVAILRDELQKKEIELNNIRRKNKAAQNVIQKLQEQLSMPLKPDV